MTFTFKKTMIACVALSTLCFASTAHAGNAFNKFPSQPSTATTQGLQDSAYIVVSDTKSAVTTTKRRIKRVVLPVPKAPSAQVSYALDTGSTNLDRGFNKMVPQANKSMTTMPVLVDNRAYTAR